MNLDWIPIIGFFLADRFVSGEIFIFGPHAVHMISKNVASLRREGLDTPDAVSIGLTYLFQVDNQNELLFAMPFLEIRGLPSPTAHLIKSKW